MWSEVEQMCGQLASAERVECQFIHGLKSDFHCCFICIVRIVQNINNMVNKTAFLILHNRFCVAYTHTLCSHTMASSYLFIYLFIYLSTRVEHLSLGTLTYSILLDNVIQESWKDWSPLRTDQPLTPVPQTTLWTIILSKQPTGTMILLVYVWSIVI